MGDTVTENDKGWVRPMTKEELRYPVLGKAIREFLVVLVVGMIVLGLLALGDKQTAVILLATAFVFVAIAAYFTFKLLTATVSTFGSPRAETMNVVRRGQIAPTYMLHDAWHTRFVAVDENRRLVAINGTVVSFDDIRKIGWSMQGNQHMLEFILKSGTKPSIIVAMREEGVMRQNYQRLANTLGFS